MQTLIENVRAVIALDHETSAAARQGPAIDVRGYAGVLVALHFGPTIAGTSHTVRVQGSSDGTSWVDLEGLLWAVNGNNAADQVGLLDITHPRYRYLRVVVEAGGTNDLTLSAIATKYNGKRVPTAHDNATMGPVFAFKFHAPAAAS